MYLSDFVRRLFPPLIIILVLPIVGCEGVGVVASSDPYVKLAQADDLLNHEGRVMQASRQLDEAIPIFEQKGDKAGLAKAYRLYGILARVGGTKDDPVILWLHRDEPIHPVAEELDNSDGYLKKALLLAKETNQLYLVANIEFLLGNNEVLRGKPLLACPYYDRTITDFAEAKKAQPKTELEAMPGVATPEQGFALAKKQAGCP
ncbi:MAG: hypothetical protein KGJ78_16295 [Alphaproteobacteria bacterium]|nr:hypothetical protein [Alphaproteobacteria bacterium]